MLPNASQELEILRLLRLGTEAAHGGEEGTVAVQHLRPVPKQNLPQLEQSKEPSLEPICRISDDANAPGRIAGFMMRDKFSSHVGGACIRD